MPYPNAVQSMEPRRAVFGALFRLSNRLDVAGTHILGELTSKQWFLLAVLTNLCPSPPTLKEAAQFTGSSYQNVKQIALKLQQKGFLDIVPDPKDRRALRLVLTEKPAQYAYLHMQTQAAFLDRLFQGFTPDDTAALLSLLSRLDGNLDAIEQERKDPK